jgi:hypothetical protein
VQLLSRAGIVTCWYCHVLVHARLQLPMRQGASARLCTWEDAVYRHAACAECEEAFSAWTVLLHLQVPRVMVVR